MVRGDGMVRRGRDIPLSRNWENFSMMRWDGVAMRGKGGCGPWDYFSAVCMRGRGVVSVCTAVVVA